MLQTALDGATDQFLEASLGLIAWPNALDTFAFAAGAIGANLMPIRAQIPGTIRETDSIGGLVDFYFNNGIYKNCIRARGIPILAKRGIMVDSDCATEREFSSDPYYQEFLRPFGLLWGAYVGFQIGEDLWACLLHRGLDQRPFDKEEQESLLRLRGQMTVAGTIGRNLADVRVSAMKDALDLVDVACVFFDRSGKINRLNAKAEGLLTDGVTLKEGELKSSAPDPSTGLRKLVWNALYGEVIANGGPSIATVPRLAKRPLVVRVQRLKGSVQDVFPATAAIGLISDPERTNPLESMTLLRTLFGLTATEMKIARGLRDGQELSDVAEELSISYETARTHLKRIFSKMDVKRQGELIALMSRLLI